MSAMRLPRGYRVNTWTCPEAPLGLDQSIEVQTEVLVLPDTGTPLRESASLTSGLGDGRRAGPVEIALWTTRTAIERSTRGDRDTITRRSGAATAKWLLGLDTRSIH